MLHTKPISGLIDETDGRVDTSGELVISCVVRERSLLTPDDADLQRAEPIHELQAGLLGYEDRHVSLWKSLSSLVRVVEELADGHPNELSTG